MLAFIGVCIEGAEYLLVNDLNLCDPVVGELSAPASSGSLDLQPLQQPDVPQPVVPHDADQVRAIALLQKENAKLKFKLSVRTSSLASLRVRHQWLNKMCVTLKHQLKDAKEAAANSSMKRGRKQRYLSARGGLELAARRVVSNSGAYALGLAAGLDVHGTTIARYELQLRSARIASFRRWQKQSYQELDTQRGNGLSVVLNRLRFDASRINLYKKSKLNATEIDCTFTTKPISSWEATKANLESRSILGTVMRCKQGSSLATLSMVEKQVSSVGLPHWEGTGAVGGHVGLKPIALEASLSIEDTSSSCVATAVVDASLSIGAGLLAGSSDGPLAVHVSSDTCAVDSIELWAVSSDAGSDVKGSRDLISSETSVAVNKWFFENDCLFHQFHIICFCLLYGLENVAAPALRVSFRVYSTMAQVLHLWRDNVREVFDAYSRRVGGCALRLKRICRVPPRPIAGRWRRRRRRRRRTGGGDLRIVSGIF